MSEFIYYPDSSEAAQPASSEQQDLLGRLASRIENYPQFRSGVIYGNFQARYWVGNTVVRISDRVRDINLQLWERLPEDDDRPAGLNGGGFFLRHSSYDLLQNFFKGNYKFDKLRVEEDYWIKRGDKPELAFPERNYRDPELGWSPLRHRRSRKTEQRAEAIWKMSVLSAGRCAELIDIVEAFDPGYAQPIRK